VNLVLAGVAKSFSAMSVAERERYLRGWAESRLGLRRKAFQALKRLAAVLAYTATDAGGGNPAWKELKYPGPLGPPPAEPRQIRPLAVTADTTLTCDVVVIGSGAGGGVVAGELAARGKDVVVLEKGDYLNEADFTQREGEMLSRLYMDQGLAGTDDLGLVILAGSCLGGGTVVNYTTSFHTPERVREEWAALGLPHFTSAGFTRSLDAVAARIGVNTESAKPSARDRCLIAGLDRLGWHHGILPRDVRGCSQGDDCGYCGYGCRRGAKQSTLVTYLADAAARGARIVVRCDARRVVREGGRAVGVEAFVTGPDLPRPVAVSVRAQAVVVAAGSIHSPALLLRSGLSLPALGRHLALHPATAVFGVMDEEIRPWTGTVQAHYSDQFADLDGSGYGFKFETAPVHPSLAALATSWESGAGFRERMKLLSHLALCGILLRDREGGRVTVDADGNPRVYYRLSEYDRAHLRHAISAAALLLESAGAREVWTPQARRVAYRPDLSGAARERWLSEVDRAGLSANQMLLVTFHQMASCRMGADARTSVVNADHQVHGVPGLYVADASAFPTASGVNPMLTIMGMAHRAAEVIGAGL